MRWSNEALERAARFRRGLLGLWDWVTGKRAKIATQNAEEFQAAKWRDEAELERMINQQLAERRKLQVKISAIDRQIDHKAEKDQRALSLSVRRVPVSTKVVDWRGARRGPGQSPH
jgi:small-conductance mechanosensitive channel